MGMSKPATAWALAALLGIMAAAPLAPQARAAAPGTDQGAFRYFAQHLLAGIGAAKFSDIPAIGGYGRPRIAVLPFPREQTKVPPSVASAFNARLLAALIRQGSRSYRFVARGALKSIADEIGIDGQADDLERNARVDILMVGRLRIENAGYVLSYQAVSVEDGTLFAATGQRFVGRPWGHAARRSAPMSAPLPGPDPKPRARIRDAQRLLADLGYHPGPADGMARMRTRAALRAFQRDQGLADHGRLTRRVMRRLRRSWSRAEIAL